MNNFGPETFKCAKFQQILLDNQDDMIVWKKSFHGSPTSPTIYCPRVLCHV